MRTQRAAGLGQPSTTRSPTFGSLQRILKENEHRREELDLGRVRRAEGQTAAWLQCWVGRGLIAAPECCERTMAAQQQRAVHREVVYLAHLCHSKAAVGSERRSGPHFHALI